MNYDSITFDLYLRLFLSSKLIASSGLADRDGVFLIHFANFNYLELPKHAQQQKITSISFESNQHLEPTFEREM